MVRLVFRPYTRVRRTICTSVSLRASTRVSSGFAPLRHSSPSFGSRHACSHSNPSQKIWVGRRCTCKRGSRTSASLRPPGFNTRRLARMSGSLVRVSRRVEWGARGPLQWARESPGRLASSARAVLADRPDGASSSVDRPGSCRREGLQRSAPRAEQRTGHSHSASGRDAPPAPIRFPPDNFKHSLTLFSKSFSSFPRGTCSLSVSRLYLALDGIYRPIRAAFPNNPTRRQRLVLRQGSGRTGLSPSPAPLSRGLGPGPSLRTLLQTTIRAAAWQPDSNAGPIPVRSPLLGESS
ncbi:hypothetical protein IEQ34_007525 [Dendrobium chrysotoxum]|uniref:Protein TAR1 n=1 Tax=Dendrobium chrysotoxum TaxID=161865 RepID=A0AAV7FMB3_DENCH|nr:hypothetical protein IEQ34_026229 [Dendrobium chrysotoxum]KAH0437599.1 hypothetical protein IEQ34_026212 [Dendrobium chrysotoxum]KAH0437600.1 hypothetical protein IEQ34_026203 [Dendrobium chrysotoxum]KAH0437726.1 hypothetical protein IEQ34_026197 [Dendrobium chrysotoxum]KAH0437844.1 hypothetical protein IEQ34_026187 [Dendrobium chrysotoxum]